ncbi:hypothetical protein [Dactylosporangium sp. CS-033363]|uniref:hypothetical protein n=1 Tax=Dactylosporangium sp. CS-033363 TaxID=3239935 RepID=UPI003D8AA31E
MAATGGDPGPPGYERRPQYRMMIVCGALGVVLATSGLVVGCAVDTEQSTQIPSVPGLPTNLPTNFPTGLPPLPQFPTRGAGR